MSRLAGWLARGFLGLLLVATLGWPLAATALAAWQSRPESTDGPIAGLMTPINPESDSANLSRPLRLAFETARLVLATEAIVLPIGLPLAFLLFRTDVIGRRLMIALLAMAAFVPLPLHATAWLGAFGNAGRAQVFGVLPFLVGWKGAAFVQAMSAIPWFVLIAGVGMRTVEPELEEAASFDLPFRRVVTDVTFRRSLGAILGASLAVAVLTAGDMTVTDLLQVRTYAEEAYLQYSLGNGPAAAAAVSIPPLIVFGLLVGLGASALMKADPERLATASERARVWPLGRGRWVLGLGLLLGLGNFVALPLYALVWRAGRVGGVAAMKKSPSWSLQGLWGTLKLAWDDAEGPLLTSLWLSAVSATLAVLLGWGLAWLGRRSRAWRWISATAVSITWALPGPVLGMAIVYAYRETPRFELAFNVQLGVDRTTYALAHSVRFSPYDSPLMIVIAEVARTFPYAVLILWPCLRSIPKEYFEIAAIDGLPPWDLIRKVGLPSTWGAITATWLVTFILAFGELPATNLTTPPGWNPLSVTIWGLLHTGVESHLAGVVLIMLAVVGALGTIASASLSRLGRSRSRRRST